MPPTRLDQIARLIEAGANPEDFREEIDELLGTGMAERDEDIEYAWEDEYRTPEK